MPMRRCGFSLAAHHARGHKINQNHSPICGHHHVVAEDFVEQRDGRA